MAVIAEAVRHMLAAGMSADAVVSAIADMERAAADMSAPASPTASARAERNRRYYEKRKTVSASEASEASENAGSGRLNKTIKTAASAPSSSPSPLKDASPTPPTENNPSPPLTPPKTKTAAGARLPAGWVPTPDLRDWSKGEWPGITDQFLDEQSAMFADYWHALPGAKGRKVDWPATWRNWIRRAVEDRRARLGRPPPSGPRKTMAETGAEVTEFFRQQAEQEDERERAAEGERGNSAHARKFLGGSV